MEIYLVGGAVRDQLLNREIKDKDYVVVGATPQMMLDLGYKQVGKDFPVFLHPLTNEEYALARKEKKTEPGYKGFDFEIKNVTLKDDLARRDLTINSLAKDSKGNIIDYFNGVEDLKNGILRHTTEAFKEDPVRVLRICRFAARYNFCIAHETKDLIKEINESDELNYLTKERVFIEIVKGLSEDRAHIMFDKLREIGSLKIIFPELDILFDEVFFKNENFSISYGNKSIMNLKEACNRNLTLEEKWSLLTLNLREKLVNPEKELNNKINLSHNYLSFKNLLNDTNLNINIKIKVLKSLNSRLKVPNSFSKLSETAIFNNYFLQNIKILSPEEILDTLTRCESLRNYDFFKKVLNICECDIFTTFLILDKQNFENCSKNWIYMTEKLSEMNIGNIVSKNKKENEEYNIKDEIYELRLNKIKDLILELNLK